MDLVQKHLLANRGDSLIIEIFNVKLEQEVLVKIPTHRRLQKWFKSNNSNAWFPDDKRDSFIKNQLNPHIKDVPMSNIESEN